MTAVNIASLSVLTTIGVNMMLDTMKEKKDHQLREEIKDRLHETLSESQRRLNKLETDVKDIVSSLSSYHSSFYRLVSESMR